MHARAATTLYYISLSTYYYDTTNCRHVTLLLSDRQPSRDAFRMTSLTGKDKFIEVCAARCGQNIERFGIRARREKSLWQEHTIAAHHIDEA